MRIQLHRVHELPTYKWVQMNEELVSDTPPSLEWGPLDHDLLRLLGSVSPAQRIRNMLEAQAFVMSLIRGRLRRCYPDLSQREINIKVFEEIDRYDRLIA
jgi:hypothetical protein